MPPTPSTSYNATELERILSTLKENKLTLSVKFNLLRPSASSSRTYLSRFNALEDQLVDLGQLIWELEVKVDGFQVEMHLLQQDDYEDETRKALKRALQLVGILDTFGEAIMRLKIALEASSHSGGVDNAEPAAATGNERGAIDRSQVSLNPVLAAFTAGGPGMASAPPQVSLSTAPILGNGGLSRDLAQMENNPAASVHGKLSPPASSADVGGPAAKGQKLSPPFAVSSTSRPSVVKKEEGVAKPGKIKTWAPEGYYFVKAHFRRLPKRKAKQPEAEAERKHEEYLPVLRL